jgi:(R)-2-hydroxyglutarate dehydrogenase
MSAIAMTPSRPPVLMKNREPTTMLPRIAPEFIIDPLYRAYLDALEQTAFSGDIRHDYASRLAVATDNSIYQVIPQAVIFPKNTADISLALTLGTQERFQKIKFSPRGGGVAANGQSLSCSIIIDCSKHMRNVLEINVQEGWVRVQPGVVQDQLNQYLLPYGMYFAPDISPSDRATIGGMINTDACGNGQKLIGRTSDHVIELTGVLSNGMVFSSLDSDLPLFQKMASLLANVQSAIQHHFPKAPRTLSGYNLLKAYQNKLYPHYLLCGSEGTLALISECKLKLTPLPNYKKCVVMQYRCFEDALRALEITSNIKPLVIECIDETLLELAREDSIYFYVKNFIENDHEKTGALNIVELVADDEKSLDISVRALCNNINDNQYKLHHAIGYYVAHSPIEIKHCWELRKKSVGLISKNKVGTRRPVPFIEDTAVPPEQLFDYIKEFKQLLCSYQLSFGMYGHVDAGCVHVRPALDLQQKEDQVLHQQLSDQVAALVKKYHGVMWGEHGMGFRTQYNALFLGDELYHVVRQIKTEFDPLNKLNPGKIAVPLGCDEELVQLSGPLRAQFDKQIPLAVQEHYSTALACNGNGACFNYSTHENMCPSFKVTQDRIHSPKGRAVLIREWLRQLKRFNFQMRPAIQSGRFFKKLLHRHDKHDFSHEVFDALNGCLGCKACTSQCPLNVDIPHLKSMFLAYYYQRYWRPFRDYCIAAIETIAQCQSYFPRLSHQLMQLKISSFFLKKWLRMVNLPKISSVSIKKELKKRKAPLFNINLLMELTTEQKEKSVIILQDALSSFYHPDVLLKTYDLLVFLGFSVYVAPFFISGKLYHQRGFLTTFNRIVRRNIRYLNTLAATQIALVGLDPSITLTYRDEYRKIPGHAACDFNVFLPQEWLCKQLSKGRLYPHLLQKRSDNHLSQEQTYNYSVQEKSDDHLSQEQAYNYSVQEKSDHPLSQAHVYNHLTQERSDNRLSQDDCDHAPQKHHLSRTNKNYFLMTHCTEKTMCVASEKEWMTIFAAFGLTLRPLSLGCCGMSGTYGHEVEHVSLSRALFKMSWQPYLQNSDEHAILVATGYSCRSQVERFQGVHLSHPLEIIWDHSLLPILLKNG